MKRAARIIFFVVLLLGFMAFAIKPLLIFLAQEKLLHLFAGSKVSIAHCKPGLRQVTFSNIEVKKEPLYDFKINEARISYNLKYRSLKLDSLNYLGFKLSKASLELSPIKEGELSIQELKYDKLKVEELKSRLNREGNRWLLTSLSAKLWDGRIQGNLSLEFDKAPGYLANLNFINCSLESLIKELDWGEKLRISGLLDGKIVLEGRGADMNVLSGDFSTHQPGGVFIIKDRRWLERLSWGSNQSLDILVESFKNYNYNTGVIKLSLEKNNLILGLALDGDAGKRNLDIIVHGFKLGRR